MLKKSTKKAAEKTSNKVRRYIPPKAAKLPDNCHPVLRTGWCTPDRRNWRRGLLKDCSEQSFQDLNIIHLLHDLAIANMHMSRLRSRDPRRPTAPTWMESPILWVEVDLLEVNRQIARWAQDVAPSQDPVEAKARQEIIERQLRADERPEDLSDEPSTVEDAPAAGVVAA